MEGSSNVKEILLGDDFGEVIVRANGASIQIHADGSADFATNAHAPANDTAAKATHEIGTIESAGDHKGEIFGGIYPADNKPIWFSAAPKLMDHFAAATWAKEQAGSLPTRKQGDYLSTLQGKGGAITDIFNRANSFPAGYVWLAEPTTSSRSYAWCQNLSDGDQDITGRLIELPVLSVFR
jgi:hypothetical protein